LFKLHQIIFNGSLRVVIFFLKLFTFVFMELYPMNNILCNNIITSLSCLIIFKLYHTIRNCGRKVCFHLTCFMFVEQELLDFIRTYHAHMAQLFIKVWHILRVKRKGKFVTEEFEDTKGLIRICKSKDRQHNGQKKKYKRTNNNLQNIHIKLKIEQHEPH